MSGGVCEPRHANGSTEKSSSVMPSFFCVNLGDITITTQGILQQAFGDDAMSKTQAFSLAQNIF
jgi:hypothetical protein